ncbi:MAG TPA: AsmA family protein [Bryobacteraceae bacterium]|nr:AsmA family protein [Bryobacteraceae bacterium]
MSRTMRRALWAAALLPCLLLAAILAAPEIEASAWRQAIEQELSRALGRPVGVRSVHYQLYPSPGLSASDLVIPEDPAFGIEPFAYVTELQVGVRLTSLLLGRLEVSSVRMVDASVNVTRAGDRGWNVSRLLRGVAAAARTGNPPALELRACRVNFRFGLIKSSYYLNNVDLDLQPPSESNRKMTWTFEASPARTDRAEQGFGRFTGDGAWVPSLGPEGTVEAGVELETSALSEVITLLAGQDLGLQGRVSSRVRMSGPLNEIRVTGRTEFMEVDRAGLFGFRGKQFQLPLKGTINLPGQSFDLHMAAQPAGSAEPPLEISLSSADTLIDPRWKAGFHFKSFPAATVAELARRLGVGLPDGIEVTGDVDGSLGFERGGPASGQITVKSAVLKLAEAGELNSPEAMLSVLGDEIRLAPAAVSTGGGVLAKMAGVWNTVTGARELELKFNDAPIEGLNKPAGALDASIPFLDGCYSGRASGMFRYRSESASPWTGTVALAGLECSVEGLASPFTAAESTLTIREDGWAFRSPEAALGALAGTVDLAWRNTPRRPLRLQAAIVGADAAELERLVSPTLSRRRSLLDRTLSFGRSSVPDWLAGRSLSGRLHIGRLTFAGVAAEPAEANLFWDGANAEFSSITMRFGEAAFAGRMTVALAGSVPAYRMTGRLDDYPHDSIIATLDMDLRTSGLGRSLLENLQASGEFQILGAAAGTNLIQPLRGAFDYSAGRTPPRLHIGSVEAGIDGETCIGTGAFSSDGRLHLDLSGPARNHRFTVTLAPWQIDTRP